ncbi:preprotein translocase subunit SecY [Candidatus Peregrinibacteria bacterium]|nr:preprotein translocase subunit SecY [Candidatus Peregrinibacteria bacterium]
MNYLLQIWHSKDLRNKILFTFGILILTRLLAQITIPGANTSALQVIYAQNQLLGMFSMLTGGSAENFSIILMGLSPYINASIIVQLLTVIIPKWENLSKEGEQGRKTLNQYTRYLTIPIAFIQSYGMLALLNSQSPVPIIDIHSANIIIPVMITIVAGSMLMMWLGELISEKGLGNGVSLLIFAGIIVGIPGFVGQSLALAQQSSEQLIPLVISILMTLVFTVSAILITEGVRNIPIIYAGRGVRGKSVNSALPIRINQAGMIPIIFAVSVMSFPTILGSFFKNSTNDTLKAIGAFFDTYLQQSNWQYLVLYFILVMAFTFFYVSITFNPEQVAENIQKRGGYIPGIRPGKQTAEYLDKVSSRLNLFGGLFIAFLAIAPMIISIIFSSLNMGSTANIVGGASLIIVVGVVLELFRQVNAQLVMHDYNKLY